MKKMLLASALAIAVTPAWATVTGDSSSTYVVTGAAQVQGPGTAGISMPKSVPLDPNDQSYIVGFAGGPLAQTDLAYSTQTGPTYYVVLPNDDIMSQTWRHEIASGAGAGTKIYAYRQTHEPWTGYPQFGGEVIAKVSGHEVYFGEWAPPGSNNGLAHDADLNMNDSLRTVYYVGENPTSSMPTLTNVAYDVVGIQKYNPDTQAGVYTGTLTANFSGTSGSITGTLNGVNFSGTSISSGGSFSNGSTITGRFYGNSAEALAGMYDTTGVANDMAFGGAQQ